MRFTPEVVVAHPVVSDPQLSPDGALVAFQVAESSRPSGPDLPAFAPSAIWIAPADGDGPATRLTWGRCDTTPRWSPDGRWLAFLSDREKDGQRQVYLLPRSGGEARRIGRVAGTVPVSRVLTSLAWFPDGRRLAFLMTEPADAETRDRIEAGDDRIVFEEEPRFQRVWSVDLAAGEVVPISPAGVQVWEFALSPDGARIAAVVAEQPHEWSWYTAALAVLDVGGSSVTELHRSRRQVARPAWTPDGRHVAFLTSNWSDRGYDQGTPMVVPVSGGEATWATGEDDDVSDVAIAFGADGRLVTATNQHAGGAVSTIDIADGERRWLWQDRRAIGPISQVRLADGRQRFTAVIEDFDNPPEVHAAELEDGRLVWRRLSDVHAPWRTVARAECRELHWQGADGTPIQGFLYLPPGYAGGRLPLVTIVHGGPAGCVQFQYHFGSGRWARPILDAGLAVFVPNFRGSTGWGLRFAEANIGDMGGEDFRDVMTGIDRIVADGMADPERLGIAGWSYGGYMSAWAITQTDRFRAAVVGAGITDWRGFHGRSYLHSWDRIHYGDSDPYDPQSEHTRFSPMTFVGNVRTPTLILHGELDWDVPVEQGYVLHRALKDLGVETRLVVYPREPHGISESEHRLDLLERVRDWFVERL